MPSNSPASFTHKFRVNILDSFLGRVILTTPLQTPSKFEFNLGTAKFPPLDELELEELLELDDPPLDELLELQIKFPQFRQPLVNVIPLSYLQPAGGEEQSITGHPEPEELLEFEDEPLELEDDELPEEELLEPEDENELLDAHGSQ